MIISHRLKFAFFRVPKTGSTTAETILRLSGAFDDNDYMTPNLGLQSTIPEDVCEALKESFRGQMPSDVRKNPDAFETVFNNSVWSFISHLTPSDAIKHGLITLEQLREYKCYAFVRSPRDRYLSAYLQTLGSSFPTAGGFQETVMNDRQFGGLLVKPMVDYFLVDGERVLDPLWFGNFDNEIKKVIGEIGGFVFKEIPRLNPSRGRVSDKTHFFTHEVDQKLRIQLKDDVDLMVQLTKELRGK